MAFPRHSILHTLSVLLLAWTLVRCQAPIEPEEEEEEDLMEATVIPKAAPKAKPYTCPPECSCTREGAVDCAGVDLTLFPAELSENTRQLSLQVSTSTHSLTLSLIYLLHSPTPSLNHPLTIARLLTHSLTQAPPYSVTDSVTDSLHHSLPHPFTGLLTRVSVWR